MVVAMSPFSCAPGSEGDSEHERHRAESLRGNACHKGGRVASIVHEETNLRAFSA